MFPARRTAAGAAVGGHPQLMAELRALPGIAPRALELGAFMTPAALLPRIFATRR